MQHQRWYAGSDVFIPGGAQCISIDVSHPRLFCIQISPPLMHSAPGLRVNLFLQSPKQNISDNHPPAGFGHNWFFQCPIPSFIDCPEFLGSFCGRETFQITILFKKMLTLWYLMCQTTWNKSWNHSAFYIVPRKESAKRQRVCWSYAESLKTRKKKKSKFFWWTQPVSGKWRCLTRGGWRPSGWLDSWLQWH